MNIQPTISLLLISMLTACLGSGCASVGKHFTYEKAQTLELGGLRESDYAAAFGTPRTVSTDTTPEAVYRRARYIDARGNLARGAARVLDLEFKNGVLNAYYYVSSFADGTTVNLAAAAQLAKGQSKPDVHTLMGRPTGKALLPTFQPDMKQKSEAGPGCTEIWAWASLAPAVTFGKHRQESSAVFVLFDETGRVVKALQDTGTNK